MMSTPINATDRVQDVLARDLTLVEVFVAHSPHFAKLRDPDMRHAMARLVTVEQAAQVAGVSSDALVRSLNAALGIDASPPAPREDRPRDAAPPSSRPPGRREVELDMREALRAGQEPFSRIMAAVATLADDDMLHLRAIFEPVPLYAVLGKRGFAHETRMHAADDWSVWFWRGDAGADDHADAREAPAGAAPGEVRLDVRGLEPPEPMVRTLAALETLAAGQTLVQVNVRVPQFLLPILAERGFEYDVDESHPDRVLVRIRRRA